MKKWPEEKTHSNYPGSEKKNIAIPHTTYWRCPFLGFKATWLIMECNANKARKKNLLRVH
jgi:hypothetical protein